VCVRVILAHRERFVPAGARFSAGGIKFEIHLCWPITAAKAYFSCEPIAPRPDKKIGTRIMEQENCSLRTFYAPQKEVRNMLGIRSGLKQEENETPQLRGSKLMSLVFCDRGEQDRVCNSGLSYRCARVDLNFKYVIIERT